MSPTVVHNAYLELLDRLERTGVCYAILHGWESLLDGDVSDLDVIASAEDLPKIESALSAHYRVLNMVEYEAGSFGFVLSARDPGFSSTLALDVSTDYRCRGRVFFTAEELVQCRKRWGQYWVVGPAQELEYLLVKKIYEKGAVPQKQRTRIEQLVQGLGPVAEASVARLFGSRGKRLLEWIQKQQWILVETHVSQLQRCLRRQVFKRDRRNPLRYWRAEIRRLWTRWHHPTGLSVGVAGVHREQETTLVGDLQAFPQTFRRMVTFEAQPGVKSSPFAYWPEFRRFVSQVRARILTARSALVIWKSNGCHWLQSADRRTAPALWLGWLRPKIDLMFIIGRPELNSPGPVQAGAHKPTVAGYWGCKQVVVLDDRLPGDQISQDVQEALADFLCKRHTAYRRLWVPSESLAAQS